MNIEDYLRIRTRRDFFRQITGGIGIAALSNLLAQDDRPLHKTIHLQLELLTLHRRRRT